MKLISYDLSIGKMILREATVATSKIHILWPNTAVDKIVIDLHGLSEVERATVKKIVSRGILDKPVEYLE